MFRFIVISKEDTLEKLLISNTSEWRVSIWNTQSVGQLALCPISCAVVQNRRVTKDRFL